MDNFLEKLNEAQRKAVSTTEGYVRLIAGAGSGKTKALSYRFVYLVNELGILPSNILCVSFTNKAAQEMRKRIHDLIGDSDTGYINTFHGFCVSVLDEESYAVQYPKSFVVLDNSDIDAMLRIIYEERGLTLRDMSFKSARDMIEILKLLKKPDYYLDMIAMPIDILREKYLAASDIKDIIFYGYLYQEKKCFGLDYNDLIKFVLYIFKEHESIRLKWQQRLEYIMIDEFQDIDKPQYELMEILSAYHKNLFIVGDPDQTIYTWRGADLHYLMEFDKTHENTKTIIMDKNYRSTPEITACANSLISKNKFRIDKALVAMNENGAKPLCFHAADSEAEAKSIAEKIKALHESGVAHEDIAILYRAHYISRNLEEVFLKEKLPYHIYGRVRFFDRAEIKDALSYLRMLSCRDDLSFRRIVNIPKRNIGISRMKLLESFAEDRQCSLYEALRLNTDSENFRRTGARKFVELIESFTELSEKLTVSELTAQLLDRSGYELMLRTEGSQERLDNLAELKQAIRDYETSCGEEATLGHYLEHAALFSDNEEPEEKHKLRMMTVHAAKGLEFPYVFLCGLNEDVFPSKKIRTLAAMEEERRLFFVAMTRAQKALYFSETEGPTLDGAPRYPSRFLLDIDKTLYEQENAPAPGLIADAKLFIENRERYLLENLEEAMLKPGTRIRHSVFGAGKILESDIVGGYYLVKFDAVATPRKLSHKAGLIEAMK